ncbi:MAG TPA: hypothetical protein PKE30_06965, partial [Niabella sp.]|nr:hypothetical protein [Niabella sp.]
MKIPKKHYTALPFFQRAFPFLFILFFLFAASSARAQCVLNCNDLVNVSIEQNGYALVTPDMMLEHPDDCPGPKEVDILIGGQPAGDTVNCSHVDRVLMVRIRDITTGNFCTGSIRVQDKLGPQITCRDTIVPCGTSSDPDSL